MKKYVEYITWVDSSAIGSSIWMKKETILESCALQEISSVGFLLKETPDYVILAGHDSVDCASGHLLIPKCAIKRRKKMLL